MSYKKLLVSIGDNIIEFLVFKFRRPLLQNYHLKLPEIGAEVSKLLFELLSNHGYGIVANVAEGL